MPAATGAGPGPIEAAALAQLEAVDRAGTVQGMLVVECARDIDAGRVKPEAKASAGQKLLQLLEAALEGTAPPVRDARDELAQRRAVKASA